MSVRRGHLLAVGVGGLVGALARYGLALALPGAAPLGTLAANTTGAFLLGLLVAGGPGDRLGVRTRLFAGTGFCSSFTTYSTFAVETSRLAVGPAAAYVGLTYVSGVAAVLLGGAVAGWLS